MTQHAIVEVLLRVGVVGAVAGVYVAWRNRPSKLATAAAVTLAGAGLGMGSELLSLWASDLSTLTLAASVGVIGASVAVAGFLAAGLVAGGLGRYLTRRTAWLLAVGPVGVCGLLVTNDSHGLIWTDLSLVAAGGRRTLAVEFGPAYLVVSLFMYALILAAAGLLLRGAVASNRRVRGAASNRHGTSAAAVLVLAALVPIGVHLLYLGGVLSTDYTPVGFAVAGLLFLAPLELDEVDVPGSERRNPERVTRRSQAR